MAFILLGEGFNRLPHGLLGFVVFVEVASVFFVTGEDSGSCHVGNDGGKYCSDLGFEMVVTG